MARRFAHEGARAVIVADINGKAAARVANAIGGTGVTVDVAKDSGVAHLVSRIIESHGCIELFCSNAGVSIGQELEVNDAAWEKAWSVNVLAQAYAARAIVPHMLERGLCHGCSGFNAVPGFAATNLWTSGLRSKTNGDNHENFIA